MVRPFNPGIVWPQGTNFLPGDYQVQGSIPIAISSINTSIALSQPQAPPDTGLILYNASQFVKLDLQITYATLVASMMYMAFSPLISFAAMQNVGLGLSATFARLEASVAAATAAATAAASTAPAWLPTAQRLAMQTAR